MNHQWNNDMLTDYINTSISPRIDGLETDTATIASRLGNYITYDNFDGLTARIECDGEIVKELLALLYQRAGVNILDHWGGYKNIDAIREELEQKNPKWTMSFDEMMGFEPKKSIFEQKNSQKSQSN